MNNLDLESTLQSFVSITSNRDRDEAERAAISAFYKVGNLCHLTSYKLDHTAGDLRVVGDLWCGNENSKWPILINSKTEPFDKISQLCYLKTHACLCTVEGDFHNFWIPVSLNGSLVCCFKLCKNTTFSTELQSILLSLASVYANYLAVLDYSERDSLTGLLNRKTFDKHFSKLVFVETNDSGTSPESVLEKRSGNLVPEQWLAVVDIDRFKTINDRFGHVYGDEVLILVAEFMRASLRPDDVIFRFGGEEFVVLLRGTSKHDAQIVFERLRQAVEKHNFPQVNRVTVSIGFVNVLKSATPVVALGQADQALYFAKDNGRNQVCFYEQLVREGRLKEKTSDNEAEFF